MRIPSQVLTPDSRILLSSDGTEIYADAIGDRSKPAVIFIHGLWMSTVVFDEIFNDYAWSSQVYLVRYDTRGHGRSGQPADSGAWDSQRIADDFATVVEAFQLHKPFVLGWSLGATTIADILSFHPPSYLSGVIYVTPLPYLGEIMGRVMSPIFHECLPCLSQDVSIGMYQEAANTFITLCSSSMSHTLRLACLGNLLLQPPNVARNVLSRAQNEEGLMIAGGAFGLPFLMVLGKKDNLIVHEEAVKSIETWAMDAEVVEMEADHMPWLGEPVTFRHEVLDWITRVASRQ